MFKSAFPDATCSTSFTDALAPGSNFLRSAKEARVGFASPPCLDISVVNTARNESSACAELTVDCVKALRMVRHEILCLETTTTVASARGGHLLQSVYQASADSGYVTHLTCMDPLRLGGSQSRNRAYIVSFVMTFTLCVARSPPLHLTRFKARRHLSACS
jgi:site-specific DNA-cytosine methylase